MGENGKSIKFRYLIVDAPSLYSIIVGRLAFSIIDVFLFSLYLMMKYPFVLALSIINVTLPMTRCTKRLKIWRNYIKWFKI